VCYDLGVRYFAATLAENQVVGPHTFVLHLDGCAPLVDMLPGQFVMLRGEWGRDPLLPRAFSVQGVRPDGICEILVKTHGRGTALLEAARPGQRFQVLGPLGTGFLAPSATRTDWLIAGGVGLAPLLFQAEAAARAGHAARVRMIYGGRTAADLVLLDRIRATGVRLELATDDGSHGFHGRVTGLVEKLLATGGGAPSGSAGGGGGAEGGAPVAKPTLMACGPDPMLVALAKLARERALKTYLSLEGEMGCGIGVCLGCAVPCATKAYRYTCREGPVMDLDELRGVYS
jgi:dihydroorotate dehydrogenase electron transfer subunit